MLFRAFPRSLPSARSGRPGRSLAQQSRLLSTGLTERLEKLLVQEPKAECTKRRPMDSLQDALEFAAGGGIHRTNLERSGLFMSSPTQVGVAVPSVAIPGPLLHVVCLAEAPNDALRAQIHEMLHYKVKQDTSWSNYVFGPTPVFDEPDSAVIFSPPPAASGDPSSRGVAGLSPLTGTRVSVAVVELEDSAAVAAVASATGGQVLSEGDLSTAVEFKDQIGSAKSLEAFAAKGDAGLSGIACLGGAGRPTAGDASSWAHSFARVVVHGTGSEALAAALDPFCAEALAMLDEGAETKKVRARVRRFLGSIESVQTGGDVGKVAASVEVCKVEGLCVPCSGVALNKAG